MLVLQFAMPAYEDNTSMTYISLTLEPLGNKPVLGEDAPSLKMIESVEVINTLGL